MSLRRRLAIWRLRLSFRIGPAVSDQVIADGLDNLAWRWASVGQGDMPETLAYLASINRHFVVRLIVDASRQRVPDTWWDA